MGRILTLSGRSGAGKTSIMRDLLSWYPEQFRTWTFVTTRQKRPDDMGEVLYLSEKEFQAWNNAGKFIRTSFHHGVWYGTLAGNLEEALLIPKVTLVDTVIWGAYELRTQTHTLAGEKSVISCFVVAHEHWRQEGSILFERLRKRGMEVIEARKRIYEGAPWRDMAHKYGFHILRNENNELGRPYQTIEEIVRLLKATV